MPTSPFAEEHATLRATVRRMVTERLEPLAQAAEQSEQVHAEALRLTSDVRGFSDDVLAEVVVAEELGRLRSGGLVAVLLDAALLAEIGVEGPAAIARGGDVRVSDGTADGDLPMVVGGATARQVVVLDAGLRIELNDSCAVQPLGALHALRGGAVADIAVRSAACHPVVVTGDQLRRAELREAAAAVAGAWVAFSDAHAYAGQRTAFGRPIGAFQVNRHALAEMATWLTAAEALVHDTAWSLAHGTDAAADTATARKVAGRTARRVTDMCLQLHGGYGYTMDFDVQRAWRDARASAVGDDQRRAGVMPG